MTMRYYTLDLLGVGYIVAQFYTDNDGCFGNRYVRNFGYKQSDALEFCEDCNSGMIDYKRIEQLMNTYTDEPYEYQGKGILKKTQE